LFLEGGQKHILNDRSMLVEDFKIIF
jgi:hypothetical protein